MDLSRAALLCALFTLGSGAGQEPADAQDPDGYLLRSLSADGRPVQRLGLVSATDPASPDG